MAAPNQSEQIADLTADGGRYKIFCYNSHFLPSPGVPRQAFALHSGRGLLQNKNKRQGSNPILIFKKVNKNCFKSSKVSFSHGITCKSWTVERYTKVLRIPIRFNFQCGSGYGSGSSILCQCGSGYGSGSRVWMTKNWKTFTACRK